jgi:hypothetical protein
LGSKNSSDNVPVDTAPPPPLRSLLTKPVLLSTAAYALLSFIDIAYRTLQPVFYAAPRELGGFALPPYVIGTVMALWGLVNGLFQIGLLAPLVKWWGVRMCYLVGIGSMIPIFALFPIMSAVVHAEDQVSHLNMAFVDSSTRSTAAKYDLSWILIALGVLQLVLACFLNLCYGSVFIYITAAAGAVPTPRHYMKRCLPSSISSRTLDESSLVSSPVTTYSTTDTHASRRGDTVIPSRKKATRKAGKKTLGAVNGIAQCTVSIMRCLGPYTTSTLYAQGLSWQYESEPISTDPEGPYMRRGATIAKGSTGFSGHYGGLLVYGALIAVVCVAFVVGRALPVEPWEAAEDVDSE